MSHCPLQPPSVPAALRELGAGWSLAGHRLGIPVAVAGLREVEVWAVAAFVFMT